MSPSCESETTWATLVSTVHYKGATARTDMAQKCLFS